MTEKRRRYLLAAPGLVHVELFAADEATVQAAAADLARLWPGSTHWRPRRVPGEDGVLVEVLVDLATRPGRKPAAGRSTTADDDGQTPARGHTA
ncbi:DUF6207 family protein [Streptomyces aculeolatus]